MAGKSVPGLVQKGNIDVNHRPSITNYDGSKSSIFSVTVPIGKDGHSVSWDDPKKITAYALVPSIVNGKFLTPDGNIPHNYRSKNPAMQNLEESATKHYDQTRQHLGIFKSDSAADDYAGLTHAYGNDGTATKVYTPSY